MLTYLTHPLHGTHIAYTEQEIAQCEKNGWTKRITEQSAAPLVTESHVPAVSDSDDAGVAPSPGCGVPCSKCGKVLARGLVMHERYCRG